MTTAAVTEPTIEFLDRPMRVREPDEAQYAILIEAERWMGRVVREREKLDLSGDLPDDHPDMVKAQELLDRSKSHLGRFLAVLGTLFLDQQDWDDIRDGMAAREVSREDMLGLAAKIIAACRGAAEPANREQRRAAKRGRRTT